MQRRLLEVLEADVYSYPQPNLVDYVRDDVVADEVPPEPSDPSSSSSTPPVVTPPYRPGDAPPLRAHRLVGAFRLSPGNRLQTDTSTAGMASPLPVFPKTVADGTGFLETSFRGQERSGATNGLGYKYYEGSWDKLPDFSKHAPVTVGNIADFDLSVRRRDDDFSIVFEGELEIPSDGLYRFFTTSDDGSRLWIGEALVVDNDGLHGAQERSGTISLSRGRHAITVAFFERTGDAHLEVAYEGPGIPKQRIPAQALFRGDTLFFSDSEGPILQATPGTFRLWGAPEAGWAWFYEDALRTFFIEPSYALSTVASQLGEDSMSIWRIESVRPRALLSAERSWRFSTFYHPYAPLFTRELYQGGVAGLYRRELQGRPEALLPPARALAFDAQYLPTPLVHVDRPADTLDFSENGPYSAYNWELFFHAPLLIAERLSEHQRFEEAQRWFHYIFDPTQRSEDEPAPDRYWRFEGFRDVQQRSIESLLRLISGEDSEQWHLSQQVNRWRKNPFDPHAIAALRTPAYQRAVVMKYIDNLIAWGDQLFRRDTVESINEATLLYVLASDLLGPRPETLTREEEAPPRTFEELHTANQDDFLVRMENLVDLGRQSQAEEDQELLTAPYYFCTPQNDKLLSYWDTVADRLFKIRHCQNIEGIERQLPLFAPPIDPGLLVRAAAAGVDIASVLAESAVSRLPYRFSTVLQAAKELCGDLKSLTGALLSALEKRDAEDLALLRAGHELVMLDALRSIRQKQVDEARKALESVRRSREAAEMRMTHYRDIPRENEKEKKQLEHMKVAFFFQQGAQLISLASSMAHAAPNGFVGVAGWAGSPLAMVQHGGSNVGSSLQAAAGVANFIGAIFNHLATVAGIQGGYDRRFDEWKLQERLAQKEMDQLDEQILAGEIRVAIAEKELSNHDLQVKHAMEAQAFMRGKFTNRELYDWMVSQLSALCFQGYQLAYDMAKRAQRAYQFELGGKETFVQFGYWDSLKKGLLAGERLHHDLKRMEISWLENNRREHELTKHVSLALLDPMALLMLRNTGECFVDLPEALFDSDHPGHYMRRLKTVSVTLPSVTGPYTSVNCTLTLLWNTVRKDAALRNGAYARATGPDGQLLDDDRFVDGLGGIQSIATSSGREDAGLFEQNLRDDRYLPFEGAGAVSRWRIQLPKETNRFDLDTLSDVILHVRYTARDGGEPLRKSAWDTVVAALPRSGASLFVADQQFPDAWHRFLHPVDGGAWVFAMTLGADHFPFQPPGLALTVKKLELFARMPAGATTTVGKLIGPGGAEHPFEWATGAGLRSATVELPGEGLAPGAFRLELAAEATAPEELAIVCTWQVREHI